MKKPEKRRSIHFTGIGGIGMSGVACVLAEEGHRISGSDSEASSITKKLQKMGADIYEGHRASNLPRSASVLVYSSSISGDNPEVVEAKRRGLKIVHRAEMLGEIFNRNKGIAITGMHGKTTTTSIIAMMLERSGMRPTVIIGGEVDELGGNAKSGRGEYTVAEADESDSSFLHLDPYYAVITNIEPEHLDHYKDMAAIKHSFKSFVANIKRGGALFYNYDDPVLRELAARSGKRTESFGDSEDADMRPASVKLDKFVTSFDCIYKGRKLGRISLNIPGRHNVQNGLAAVLVGLNLGLKFERIARAIKGFGGAKRRFQLRCENNGIMLIEDYAHHPTEIRAVLDACKGWNGKRIIAVFQPHRYTRTKFLAKDFGRCFNGADKVILTDIYAASEKPIKGVTVKTIYDRIRESGQSDVVMLEKDGIAPHVESIARPGDMILVLGAGDIKKVADELAGKMTRFMHSKDKMAAEIRKIARGRIFTEEPLKNRTSFKIGGPADIWVEPNGVSDLRSLLRYVKKNKVPYFVIGNGSNVLASDFGFRGVIISLASNNFRKIAIKGTSVIVGAGHSLSGLVRAVCAKGLGGLESLVGIPGTVGGAIFMNAGGYANPIYRNIGEFVTSVKVMNEDGAVKLLKKEDLEFGYRRSNLEGYVILEAHLGLVGGQRKTLESNCSHFLNIKRTKQALDVPSAGCAFKNPSDFHFTCGQMIDMLGFKGKRWGGAEISIKHANFIVNRDRATCKDVLSLVDMVRKAVRDNYGIDLEMEIKVL
jgi:UDP-N-acetylmuramate--L-alanine ligase/UDP-N-acetylenolpyruvoylglucosamine reductase